MDHTGRGEGGPGWPGLYAPKGARVTRGCYLAYLVGCRP